MGGGCDMGCRRKDHKGQVALRHNTNQPASPAVPYDLCLCISISHLLAMHFSIVSSSMWKCLWVISTRRWYVKSSRTFVSSSTGHWNGLESSEPDGDNQEEFLAGDLISRCRQLVKTNGKCTKYNVHASRPLRWQQEGDSSEYCSHLSFQTSAL